DNNGRPASASPTISLTIGTLYYLEGLMKEGGGGDYMEVAFRAIDSSGNAIGGVPPTTEVATNTFFTAPGSPDVIHVTFLRQPQSTNVYEGQIAAFSVSATLIPNNPVTYQWQRNGVNIPGATSTSYTITNALLSDSGSTYRVILNVPGQSPIPSSAATLTVLQDTVGQTLLFTESLDGI